MKLSFRHFAPVVVSSVLFSCHGDLPTQVAPTPAPDPCLQPVTSRHYFVIGNQLDDKYLSSDTIFPGKIRLAAPATYKTVSWQIGSDPRLFTSNNFILTFPQAIGTVTIRFVGTRNADPCLPGDKGVDTLCKQLTVVPFNYRRPRAAIEGVYVGATTDTPKDTFSVRIYNRQGTRDTTDYNLNLYNLNKGCPGLDMNLFTGYKAIVFNQTRGDAQCHGIYGVATLDSLDRNKLRVTYQEQVTPGQPQYVGKTFIGYRKK